MDPNVTLTEALALAARIQRLVDSRDETPGSQVDDLIADLADALAQRVSTLDGWLSTGGFLPTAWAR